MSIQDYTRRDFLKTIAASAAAIAVPGCSSGPWRTQAVSSTRKPNFVFILIDDLGWKDLGFMGSRYCETPNIDKLAGQGVIFTSAYTNAPNCAPTRASIMSGQYTPRHGIYTVGSPARGKAYLRKLVPIQNKTTLDSGVVTIAEALKPAGYVCGHFGKWHLGRDKNYKAGKAGGPASQGFDDVLTTRRANSKADPKADAHHTREITDAAITFIKKNKDKPFFCYVPHNTIHTPIMEDPALIAKYKAKPQSSRPGNNPIVAAMIETLDKNLGRLLQTLDDLKITDNTVVFFFSDNGGVVGNSSMGPLRGGKGMLYEGGIRVPLVVRWPGRVKPGSICDVPVIGIDFYPTMLEMADAPKPPAQILDGESIVPLLEGGKTLKRKAIFWHFPAYLEANYGFPGVWRTTPAGAVRCGGWKLIEFFEDSRLELYNLKNDIGEKHNLAQKMPRKTKQLHDLLKSWRSSVNAPVPTELNPKYNPDAKSKKRGKRKK